MLRCADNVKDIRYGGETVGEIVNDLNKGLNETDIEKILNVLEAVVSRLQHTDSERFN